MSSGSSSPSACSSASIGTIKPAFVDPDNLLNLTASNAFVGILSLGMVFLLAMREIDLSIGWMFNFSAVVCALAIRNGVDPFLAGALRHRLRCVCSDCSTASSPSACAFRC